mgnify:CR=1 FL=1
MRPAKRLLLCIVAPMVGWASIPSAMAEPPPDPRQTIEEAYKNIAVAAREATDQKALSKQLIDEMDARMDHQGFSARTLKGKWDRLSASQRARFIKHFKRLVIHTYAKRFKPGASFEVEYRDATRWLDESKTRGEVMTTVMGEKAGADVDYLVRWDKRKKTWKIIDITVDEVSMSRNWRRQFVRVIDDEGFEALIKRIRKKTDP